MAIALDATSTGSTHTCTGSNLILFVAVTEQGNPGTPTATYNGVSMTSLGTQSYSNGSFTLFYLLNPATGSHTVSVSSGADSKTNVNTSYTGVKQTGQPDASSSGTNNSATTSLTGSVNTVADNCWVILGVGVQGDGVHNTSLAASTGATSRVLSNSVTLGAGIFDNNASKTPAGSVSDSATFFSARNGDWIVSIAPFTINNYTRSLSDSVSYGASRTVTLSRMLGYGRSLTDSIMNGASRFATVSKGYARSLSDSIMNGASRFVTLSRIYNAKRSISASILNGASRFVTLLSPGSHVRVLTDSIMNGASRLTTLAFKFFNRFSLRPTLNTTQDTKPNVEVNKDNKPIIK